MPAAGPAVPEPGRWRLLSLVSTIGLVVVLVSMAGFAVWASQATSRMAGSAAATAQLSEYYRQAAAAVAAEESLERKYRLEPSSEVRARYETAAAQMEAAMHAVRAHGGAPDAAVVDKVLRDHATYLGAIVRMFAAVMRGDQTEATRIDREEVDSRFATVEQLVTGEAQHHHEAAQSTLAQLRDMELFVGRATPVVFAIGLVLVALFTSVLRRVRHQLDAHRVRSVYDSLHDALTGLPNRALLADRVDQALRVARRDGGGCALLLLDLDRFKEVNDALGHHCGDALLAQIGPRLVAMLREVDTVARLGGDEFAVLLPGVDQVDAALAAATRLREALAESFVVGGLALDVEASIGVAVSGVHGDDSATLLQRADVAMYLAKERHVGVSGYDPGLDANSPQRLATLGELKRALEHGGLILHYQPKVSLSTGQLCGVEALVRWAHPDRGTVPPDEFIPLAEHTGLIGPLTEYVLNMALAQTREWCDAGVEVPVAVNISARNLSDGRLPAMVSDLLRRHRIPARLLLLEVTESAIMAEPERARALLTQLDDLGVRIAVDDFGAGYTSLAQLKSLPVSELKVDRSFVSTVETDASNALIVQSIVDLGHNLGLAVVAEGVETRGALDLLAGFGCDVAQGYHLSRPLAPAAFLAWRKDFACLNLPPAGRADGFTPGGTRTARHATR